MSFDTKWLVWHGKSRQSVSRIKALDATLLAKEGYEHSTLYWNLRRLYFYIENNADTLVNYGMCYHKGLPISSTIAESAVNLVVNHRMAKKQQMRWTDEGAHCLAHVRVAVLNEEFSVKELAELTKLEQPPVIVQPSQPTWWHRFLEWETINKENS